MVIGGEAMSEPKLLTREEIIRRLRATVKPKPNPAPPPAVAKEGKVVDAVERWNTKPTEAVIQDATSGNHALAQRIKHETMEARRRQQEKKEMAEFYAEGQDPRARYQRELDRWWQSKLDAEAALEDEYDYSTGYKERRYKSSCHRGPGDSDWGLR
jgi:hypothetical protein